MRKGVNKKSRFLDLTQFILSGPYSPKLSPVVAPLQIQSEDNATPLSRPLFIQVDQNQHSPYLKELLSKVGSSQIQFFDFTLEGSDNLDFEENQQDYDIEKEQEEQEIMSVIEEESSSKQIQVSLKDVENNQIFQYNPDEYIPNMHLLQIDADKLNIKYFEKIVKSLSIKIGQQKEEELRQFVSIYLTDENLQNLKEASINLLIEQAKSNLLLVGNISKLQRKAKVSKYIQKKKKRIWKKKINYDCRKKVADSRLRVKGKFVTREQACQLLNIQLCSMEELQQILKVKEDKQECQLLAR